MDCSSSCNFYFKAVIMEVTKFLIFAFVGLYCIVDVKAQDDEQKEYGFRDGFLEDVPKAVVDVFEAFYKLQQDYYLMKNNSKYDGTLIKTDIQAIFKLADSNSIVIPTATKTKIDAFMVSLDKMISGKKIRPHLIRAGVFSVVRLLKTDTSGFQKFPELTPSANPTSTASILRMNICAEFCY